MTTRRTPNVFVAGAGPVAGALAGALRLAGVPVLGIWARRVEAARAAAAAAGVAAYAPEPPELLDQADAVIVAVADDAIAAVAGALVESGRVGPGQVLLQCAGARPAAEVFAGVAARVGGVGTLHPLRAIVVATEAARALPRTTFGVEGDAAGRAMATELVGLLGAPALSLDAATMPLYHAAAALASNGLVALLAAAAEVLEATGRDRPAALAALLPLVEGTVENLGRAGEPHRALTGPIARGDVGTVERHLRALAARSPGALELYRALGRRAVSLARERGGAPEEALARIDDALAGLE